MFRKLFRRYGLEPASRTFGFDRGAPVDRYYIERFLANHAADIKGVAGEIAEDAYTRKFGGPAVTKSVVLMYPEFDLEHGVGIPDSEFDCLLFTQTFCVIYDIFSAARNAVAMLKPGGTALLTVPGITQISRYDMDRWGHFWSFTDASARRLFGDIVGESNVDVVTYGNVRAATAFLYGYAQEELTSRELDHFDPDYQVTIGIRVTRPTG